MAIPTNFQGYTQNGAVTPADPAAPGVPVEALPATSGTSDHAAGS